MGGLLNRAPTHKTLTKVTKTYRMSRWVYATVVGLLAATAAITTRMGVFFFCAQAYGQYALKLKAQ